MTIKDETADAVRVDALAKKLAACDGLDWNEPCLTEQTSGDDMCGSGTCIAAHFEDHEPEIARGHYRAYARAALSDRATDHIPDPGKMVPTPDRATDPESIAERWTARISAEMGVLTAGCWRCGALSEILARILCLSGIKAEVVMGKANGVPHVWVQAGGVVYDPTAGQFTGLVSYEAPDRATDQSSEMQAALSFCYAILAPGQDANAILQANPEKRSAAHRAIYERRPHDDPYDAMMARIPALDDRATDQVRVPGEDWPAAWKEDGFNGAIVQAQQALRYLAVNDRPIGGEQFPNAACCEMIANELERTRKRYAALAAPARQPIADLTGERWLERWYGSEPEKGSAIVTDRRDLIAYLGGDQVAHAAATAIASAHNAALATLTARLAQAEGERDDLRDLVVETLGHRAAVHAETASEETYADQKQQYAIRAREARDCALAVKRMSFIKAAEARAALVTPQVGRLTARQPCDTCGKPVAVHAVSPSECFCSNECADPQAGGKGGAE